MIGAFFEAAIALYNKVYCYKHSAVTISDKRKNLFEQLVEN